MGAESPARLRSLSEPLHLIGAAMFIGGYGASEAYCLRLAHWISRVEFWSRVWALLGLSLGGIIFFAGVFVSSQDAALGLCCADDYHIPGDADIAIAVGNNFTSGALEMERVQKNGGRLLFNTADDAVLVWKITAFWCEVCACCFVGVSLVIIWWWSATEWLDIGETRDPN